MAVGTKCRSKCYRDRRADKYWQDGVWINCDVDSYVTCHIAVVITWNSIDEISVFTVLRSLITATPRTTVITCPAMTSPLLAGHELHGHHAPHCLNRKPCIMETMTHSQSPRGSHDSDALKWMSNTGINPQPICPPAHNTPSVQCYDIQLLEELI